MEEKQIKVQEVTWEDFKRMMQEIKKDEAELIVFRGHKSSDWKLESTLQRFIPKTSCFRSSDYYSIVKKIYEEKIISEIPALPKDSPFLLSIMWENE